ncbi:MAG TPA: helix-turn-helix transcriptional regulator [Microlunatus sp.]|nr:helix-turn-helix transcriptional regulator [Microlunatus sp.]
MAQTPDRSDRADRPDRSEKTRAEKTDRSDGGGKTGSEGLARILRDRREQLGMSRQDLADATGIPYPTVAQIETAYRGVSPARLGVIARVLGLDPKDLYDVLASDGAEAAGADVFHQAAGSDRPRAAGRVDEGRRAPAGATWHDNPTFAAAMPLAAAPPAPRQARSAGRRSAARRPAAELSAGEAAAVSASALGDPPSSPRTQAHAAPADVIDDVVDLLATLPPDQRIEALGRVQNLLLERLLAERLAGE